MTDNTTIKQTIDDTFKSIGTQLVDMTKGTRTLQDELKSLNKLIKQTEKSNKNRKKRPQVKLCLSNELEKFLSVNHGTKLTKAEVMKSVSTYIKEKNLQIQEDRRKFVPNKELSKIFGLKKANKMTFVEINKHVSHHLTNVQ